ncbi:MAG: hypothetical protein EOO61_14510 [Hymenobacter sp.]|nr:MAG: hypothetical protein EOO61_14510 [Hymenobacter sp.]
MLKLLSLLFSSDNTRSLNTNAAPGDDLLTPQKVTEIARDTRRIFFDQALAKDDGGPTNNRHILAKRFKNSGDPVTMEMLNTLAEGNDGMITSQVFEYFESLTIDSAQITCPLPLSDHDRSRLNKVVGSTESNSAIKVTGVYLFRDSVTGELLYLGSSKHLGARGPQYLVPSRQKNFKGLWGNFIRSNPTLSGVTIGFIILPVEMAQFYIALEQYLLLKYTSLYNVLILATPGGGASHISKEGLDSLMKLLGHTTHMYLEDRSARVHSFLSTRDAAKQLGSINHNSIAKGMANDRPVKGFYFCKEVLPGVRDDIRPIADLSLAVSKAVVAVGRKSSK